MKIGNQTRLSFVHIAVFLRAPYIKSKRGKAATQYTPKVTLLQLRFGKKPRQQQDFSL